ncbi:MAG TPA: hypothetical protein QGF58_11300 [Myxococcota bacterium]|nr:hypothetical protein [Myxococcota bacterium]
MLFALLACPSPSSTPEPQDDSRLVSESEPLESEPPEADWPEGFQLWIYLRHNLLVDENLDEALSIVDRAAAAGYTGVVVADFKVHLLHTGALDETYDEHLAALLARIEEHGMVAIPAVLPFGYSEGILRSDANLAEGQAVVAQPFVVGSAGVLEVDSEVSLPGGDFSSGLAGWTWWDDGVSADDGAARVEEGSDNARLVQTLDVEPHRQLHVSFRLKTQDFSADWFNVMLYDTDAGRSLNSTTWEMSSTQDWTRYDITVNTAEAQTVSLYLGVWGNHSGTAWFDDVSVTETAPVNLIRRDGAPIDARSDGRELIEGVDLDDLVDTRLRDDGTFDEWHEPVVITVPEGSSLSVGDRVELDYYAVAPVYGYQVGACLTEPAVHTWVADNLAAVAERFPEAPAVFSMHDEMRHMNTCGACAGTGQSAGELLADHMVSIQAAVETARPGSRLLVWSDMFDPNHNAHDDYYLVDGDISGSWEGLEQDVLLVNWLHSPESLAHFDGLGHDQVIAGFYDSGDGAASAASEKEEAAGIELAGMMYTTWTGDWSQLEAYAEEALK